LKNSTVSKIMLLLLLSGLMVFAFEFNVKPAKAWTGTVYIRADGSIDPPDAPIQRDGNVYTLTGNITSSADGIVVERDNIVIDGNGYTLQGTTTSADKGVNLSHRSNVTIKNTTITNFQYGIRLDNCSNSNIKNNIITDCTEAGILIDSLSFNNKIRMNYLENASISLSGSNNFVSENQVVGGYYGIGLGGCSYNIISNNNITKAYVGIELEGASYNIICGNNIVNNEWYGVLIAASDNRFYYNNLINNTQNVIIHAPNFPGYANFWDNGYPSGGNYWSNYTGTDNYSGPYQDQLGSDGIGDTPYVIDKYNRDRYPLMKPLSLPPPDYPFAEWIESPNYTPADERNITYIVIHVMDGYFEGTIDWFQNPDSQASAHYLVSQEGEIVQMVREKDIAWHAGNWEYNQRSIGIEHEDEGNWDKPNWTTEELYQASAALVRYLCDKYGIPKDRNHIIGHNEVPGVTKPCPGPYWDWGYFMGLVKGVLAPRKFWAVWEDVDYPVLILSNSTVSNFTFNQSEAKISFNLTGPSGAKGFCNVTIPKNLLRDNPWTITVNGVPITDFSKTENDTHSFIYFTYTHTSTLQVTIQGTWVIPEFPLGAVLPGSLVLITIPLILIKKRCRRKAKP